jgi:hypothetical protein
MKNPDRKKTKEIRVGAGIRVRRETACLFKEGLNLEIKRLKISS